MKIFVSTHPFGLVSSEPVDILNNEGIRIEFNPYGRKIQSEELKKHLVDKDGLIAGTENISSDILNCAPKLKIIARVGIGLDGIDFEEIKRRNILLTYTPEALSQAVAELTIGNMFNLARSIPHIHMAMKKGRWKRMFGFELAGKTIGLIGFGRIGQHVAKMLQGFSCMILVNDIAPDEEAGSKYRVHFCEKDELYRTADIITLHIPKTPLTLNLIDEQVFSMMKKSACLINTSRGGIVNENDLFNALKNEMIASAAIDVYEMEPYISGCLCRLNNIILTCHSGSCSQEARYQMEKSAAQEIIQFAREQKPLYPVTSDTMQMERSHKVIPINATWHELINTFPDNRNHRYKLYRRRWGQYPTHSIVGPYPLNIDIELVHNKLPDKIHSIKRTFAPTSISSRFMEKNLFFALMEEFKEFTEPTAIRLGFRGSPFTHPGFFEMVAETKQANSIETIASILGFSLTDQIINKCIESRLDILNVFVPQETTINEKYDDLPYENILKNLGRLRHHRTKKRINYPKVCVFTEIDINDLQAVTKFTSFWKYWADVIAVNDTFQTDSVNFENTNVKWTCSRLWQRLMVTVDGHFLLCNYDFEEKCKLGCFPEMSIRKAWTCDILTRIRQVHQQNKSHEISPCRECPFRKTEILKC